MPGRDDLDHPEQRRRSLFCSRSHRLLMLGTADGHAAAGDDGDAVRDRLFGIEVIADRRHAPTAPFGQRIMEPLPHHGQPGRAAQDIDRRQVVPAERIRTLRSGHGFVETGHQPRQQRPNQLLVLCSGDAQLHAQRLAVDHGQERHVQFRCLRRCQLPFHALRLRQQPPPHRLVTGEVNTVLRPDLPEHPLHHLLIHIQAAQPNLAACSHHRDAVVRQVHGRDAHHSSA